MPRKTEKTPEKAEAPPAEPEDKPVAEPEKAAPAPPRSLCVDCERSCKSTLMCVSICGRFHPKLRP